MSEAGVLPLEYLLRLAEESYSKKTIKVAEVECYVTTKHGVQVVVPRGTEADVLLSGNGWRDVIRDMRLIPWYDKRVGWSHAGFLKGARGIAEKGLYGLLRRELPIVFVGHSMGGAISLNAAAILKSMGFNVTLVVTFGAPRTFLKSTAKNYRKKGITVFQYSNPGDPITDVPFRWWRYRHVKEISTGRAGGYGLEHHAMSAYREEPS